MGVSFGPLKMRFLLYLCCVSVCKSLVVNPDDASEFPRDIPDNLEDLISLIERENLAPSGQKPVEYASYIWNGDWSSANVKNVDGEENRQLTGEEVRKNLAKIILAAKRKKQNIDTNVTTNGELTLEDIFPGANIRIGGDRPLVIKQITSQETTTEQATTTKQATTTEEITTTEQVTTTTENPANFPKTGDLELLAEDIVFSGHMIHWSVEQGYLAISDIW